MAGADELDHFRDVLVLGDPAAIVQRVFDDVITPLSKLFVNTAVTRHISCVCRELEPASAAEASLKQALLLVERVCARDDLCRAGKLPTVADMLNTSQHRAEVHYFERLLSVLRLVSHAFDDEIALSALRLLWCFSHTTELQVRRHASHVSLTRAGRTGHVLAPHWRRRSGRRGAPLVCSARRGCRAGAVQQRHPMGRARLHRRP